MSVSLEAAASRPASRGPRPEAVHPRLVLADLLHEPADRRHRQHDRQRRAAVAGSGTARGDLGSAVDRGRLHARAREPADAVRLDRRSDRAAARVPVGLVLFTLGSLLCLARPEPRPVWWCSEMLQGVGGSMLNPVAMSIIRNTFSDPRERARAIGVWGATVGISIALGPVVGGALVAGGRTGVRSSGSISRSVSRRSRSRTVFVPESQGAAARGAPIRSVRCW